MNAKTYASYFKLYLSFSIATDAIANGSTLKMARAARFR